MSTREEIKNFSQVISQMGMHPIMYPQASSIEVRVEKFEDKLSDVFLTPDSQKKFKTLVDKVNHDPKVKYILLRISENYLTLWIDGCKINLFDRTFK